MICLSLVALVYGKDDVDYIQSFIVSLLHLFIWLFGLFAFGRCSCCRGLVCKCFLFGLGVREGKRSGFGFEDGRGLGLG